MVKKSHYIVFLVLFAFTLINQEFFHDSIYSVILLLPILYVVLFFIEKKYYAKYNMVYWFLQIVLFFKFFLTPLVVINAQEIRTIGPAPSNWNFDTAVYLLLYEQVVISIVKVYFLKKKNITKQKMNFIHTRALNVKFIMVMGLLLCYFVAYPESMLPQNIFVEYDYSQDLDVSKGNFSLIAKWLKILSFPVIALWLFRRFNYNKAYFFSVLVLLFFAYLQIGTSRWTLIFYGMVSLKFLFNIYGNKVKKIIYPLFVLGSFVILSMSIYKFSWAINSSVQSNKFIAVIEVMGDQFQAYFSGPSLVTQTIDMVDNSSFRNKISLETLVNDFVGSLPIFSANVDQKDRINYYFNEYIFGYNTFNTSQIAPMTGIGYAYFGELLAPIFVVIYLWIGFVLERKSRESKDSINSYLYLYMSVWSMMCIGFSTQIIWGNWIAVFIPLIILNSLINLVFKK
ncbi:hypothetical protein [Bergeyella zoohelcum]|uniref:Oligosaccharide repeat unit polymerase n=1 Tax=Bergeyella zoohelcum TaxID=1015 RepID=A0A7Z9CGE9_9FLAO|nr:hypothetical protein [Bergeyella zoohelcum]VDH05089.1 Uncharacterised protein [Bergeyella zoohelcum]